MIIAVLEEMDILMQQCSFWKLVQHSDWSIWQQTSKVLKMHLPFHTATLILGIYQREIGK